MILRKLPHYRLRNGGVHFLNAPGPLPPLSEGAMRVLARLTPQAELAALEAETGTACEAGISELLERGICQLVAPVKVGPDDRRRVLVIEPHCDDAALSVGAQMWAMRRTHAFDLVTLAGRSNYTSSFQTGRPFFDRAEVSALRAEEGALFMQHMGGRYRALDLPEAALRYQDADWSQVFFEENRVPVAVNSTRQAAPEVLALWTDKVEQLLRRDRSEELWLPLGAGSHSDHDLARNAVLTALMRDPGLFEDRVVRVYRDVPYGADSPEHCETLLRVLSDAGARFEADHVDVTEGFARKLDLLGCFASQFKVPHVRPGVERSAAADEVGGRKFEHMWRLHACPDQLDTTALFHERARAEALRFAVERWSAGGAAVRRLRVLLLGASGRWCEDEELLRRVFPDARIEVFASPTTRAEVAARKGPQTVLRDVAAGPTAWGLLALRLALAPPARTLFVCGDRQEAARNLSRLWPASRTLVVPTLEQVSLVLDGRRQPETGRTS